MSSVYQENLDFVKKGIRVCCEKLRDPEVTPVSGTFPAYRIHFGFRGTKNIAAFRVEPAGGSLRRLQLTVFRNGTDLAVSYYMEKGTNEALLNYLDHGDRVSEFLRAFQELSDSVDEKCD